MEERGEGDVRGLCARRRARRPDPPFFLEVAEEEYARVKP